MQKVLKHPFVLALMVAFGWGLNFPFSKGVLAHIDPYSVRLLACVFTLIVYVVFIYPVRCELQHISLRTYGVLMLLSIPIATVVPLTNLVSLTYLHSTVAIILINTMPAINTLLQNIIYRHTTIKDICKMACCLIGVYFTLDGSYTFGTGEYIVLTGAFIWAVGGILNDRYAPKDVSQRLNICIQLICGIFLTLVFSGVWYTLNTDNISVLSYIHDPYIRSLRFWVAILYIGFMVSGVAFISWYTLLKHHGSQYAAYSVLLVPVVGVVASTLMLQEKLSLSVGMGLVFMLISVVINSYDSSKSK